MCDEKLLISTKTILKFLIKNRSCETLDSIQFHFYNYARVNIPFYDLGYNSLTEFLQSIPDILEVDLKVCPIAVRPASSRASTISNQLIEYSPVSHNKFTYRAPLQCNRVVHTPMSFPLVLPWTCSALHPSEPSKRLLKPLSIKKPESIYDHMDNLEFPLEPRTYGDGKCSSPELPDAELDNKLCDKMPPTNDFKLIQTEQKKFDFDKITDHSPDKDEKSNFDENLVPEESLSSYSSSPMVDVKESIALQIDHTYDYDRDYFLSSPEEKSDVKSSFDSCDPFACTEIDDGILMLTSNFYNGMVGVRYETTNINDIMEVGKVYEVYVSEVNSPYKFWFQLGDDDPNPVDELQENLNICYTMTECVPELIKKEHIHKGYACAALYNNTWHRGEIQGQPINDMVTIYFVDYGTVDQVYIDSIRYLLINFCSTPQLCHRGTLDFVKPINCRWTIDTTTFFLGLVSDRKLIAGVSEIDQNTNSVRVYLMDSKTRININRTLVSEGYAFPDDPKDRYQRHIADVQPSFDALEKGDRASFSEVYDLMEQNYDYEKYIIDMIINEETDCFIPNNCSETETIRRMEEYQQKKEEAKQLALRRDNKMFLKFFGDILNNPFFNATMEEEIEEKNVANLSRVSQDKNKGQIRIEFQVPTGRVLSSPIHKSSRLNGVVLRMNTMNITSNPLAQDGDKPPKQ